MEVEVIFAILAFILALMYLYNLLDRTRQIFSKIPGPKTLPIVGNAHLLKPDGHEFFEQMIKFSEDHGPVFKLLIGNFPLVFLSGPEEVELVIKSTKNLTKARDYDFIKPWLRLGLLTSSGEKWKSRRKMLTPTFHFRILNDFVHVFNEQADTLIERLDQVCAKGQGEVDIFPYLTLCALDIVCEAAMGKAVNAQRSEGDSEYVQAVYDLSILIMERSKTLYLRPDFLFNLSPQGRAQKKCLNILHGFTRNVIVERDREMRESPESFSLDEASEDEDVMRPRKARRLAFLDLLLDMSRDAALTYDDIQEEVDTFMFEGHDTTAAAMTWAMYLIGSHPAVQKKIHEEIDGIFGGSNRPFTMADIRGLKYLESVIKETLRILPSVGNFARNLDEDTEIGGYHVPKGTSVFVMIAAMHRNPQLFPDPLKFDPERFSKENNVSRHPFAYIPFSAGPRNCIGQKFALNEEKVILGSILRRFHIESTQKWDEIKPEMALIVRPADGIKLKISHRVKGA